jgi:hypothetical protein
VALCESGFAAASKPQVGIARNFLVESFHISFKLFEKVYQTAEK